MLIQDSQHPFGMGPCRLEIHALNAVLIISKEGLIELEAVKKLDPKGPKVDKQAIGKFLTSRTRYSVYKTQEVADTPTLPKAPDAPPPSEGEGEADTPTLPKAPDAPPPSEGEGEADTPTLPDDITKVSVSGITALLENMEIPLDRIALYCDQERDSENTRKGAISILEAKRDVLANHEDGDGA